MVELAKFLCVHKVTVARILRQLKEEGVIAKKQLENRQKILLNRKHKEQRLDRIRRIKANGLQDRALFAYTFDTAHVP